MDKPSITDWIQTFCVVSALIFAVYELRFASTLSNRELKQRAADMLAKGSTESVIASASALLKLSNSPAIETVDKREILTAMTPMSEYLLEWGVCYDNGICDKQISMDYACSRISSYENRAELIFERYAIEFNRKDRPLQRTKLWNDCKAKKNEPS